ncbi:MAG: hypothetical protein ACI8S6_000134 [Myxococcota bacterium]|jgi:hypothetical protein
MSVMKLLWGIGLMVGCSGQPTPAAPPPATPAPPPERREPALEPPGDEQGCAVDVPCAVDDLTVTVTSIEDSRCPANARCIQAGNAAVAVMVGAEQLSLHTSESAGPQAAVLADGRSLSLVRVDPFPGLGDATAARRATLQLGAATP